MIRHIVQQGECVSSIAEDYGFFWQTIWNHPENSALKQARGEPNVLEPGDEVVIPDKTLKEQNCPSDQRHSFRRKGTPAKLRLRLLTPAPPPGPAQPTDAAAGSRDAMQVTGEDPEESQPQQQPDQPRANVPYVLDVDGILSRGTTDSDGQIEIDIPPNAQRAQLIVEPGTDRQQIIPLHLGHLNPISSIEGVCQRLANLGFDCGSVESEENPDFQAALHAFQEKNGLEATGRLNEETRNRLHDLHGS
jgi:N-acetylmuramoyl-L-alanine amidase